MIEQDEFQQMFLLFEELIRKEVKHFCDCNPNLINAYDVALNQYAHKKVGQTLRIIYGKEKALEFVAEIEKRKA